MMEEKLLVGENLEHEEYMMEEELVFNENLEKVCNYFSSAPISDSVGLACKLLYMNTWPTELPGKPEGWEDFTFAKRNFVKRNVEIICNEIMGEKAIDRYYYQVIKGYTSDEFEDLWQSKCFGSLKEEIRDYFPNGQEQKDMMEEYKKLLEQLSSTPAGKHSRELHKKLKKYGDGIEFNRRYPKFDSYLVRIAFAVSLIALILEIIW